uniref:Uncharacterized protein n=1 Tax=Cacopsylla melanoneura TaxID=428564 RepID=A0A8D8R155_9HEMI
MSHKLFSIGARLSAIIGMVSGLTIVLMIRGHSTIIGDRLFVVRICGEVSITSAISRRFQELLARVQFVTRACWRSSVTGFKFVDFGVRYFQMLVRVLELIVQVQVGQSFLLERSDRIGRRFRQVRLLFEYLFLSDT